jgi:nitric oxide reductase NorE protein
MTPTDTIPAAQPQAVHIPGEAGLWIMIFGDMMVFGLFFITFAAYRIDEAALFAASQHQLNQALGLINTVLLLTSSFAVATAVKTLRAGHHDSARRATTVGIALGLGFVGVKAMEYGEKFAAGILPTTNDFFMFYFAFTAIHLLHVLVGLAALLFVRSRCTPNIASVAMGAVEGCGVFWHLVDVLWVILFAIFYLHQ